MKKQILAMSILAALTGCDIDNRGALEVPATFDNEFTTEVSFYGTESFGFDVQLTTGHGNAQGTLIVNDVNYGEAEPNYDLVPEAIYGSFSLTYLESGFATWVYELDETNPEVEGILDNPAASLTDSITITSLDGSTTTINFIIQGVDPTLPAEIKGALSANASIRETSAFGAVKAYDPNFGQSKFVANATFDEVSAEITPIIFDDEGKPVGILSANGYGSLFISAEGAWEFKVDKKADGLADLLPEPDSSPVADSVTMTTVDGTTETLNVNIYGAVPNFAPELLSSTVDDSIFDVNMVPFGVTDSKGKEGKVVFKLKITDDISKKGSFSLGCSRNFHKSENRRVATFYIQPDGQFEMWSAELKPGKSYDDRNIPGIFADPIKLKPAVFDQRFVPGEWSEVVMTWEGASQTQKPVLHAWLDGVPLTSDHPAIPTVPTDGFVGSTLGGFTTVYCMNQMRFYVNADEEDGGTGAFLVDDVQYYDDITAIPKTDADKALLNEKFANSQPGEVVMDIDVDGQKPYSLSSETVLVTKDL